MKKINKTILSNGLTVVSDNMSVASVTINILIKVGSRHESIKYNGISHFLEHMAFKGTKTRDAKKIAEEFDAIGGYFNAYTSKEHTVYVVRLLEEDIQIGLDILADILQNSIFASAEINKELNVILQEIAQTNDNPDELIFDNFQAIAFDNQAIGRSILGSKETISNFRQQDFIEYTDKYYKADNMIISVVSKIAHDKIVQLVDQYFGNSKKSQSPINYSQANYTGGYQYLHKDLEQVHFLLGFQGVDYHHQDFYPSQLLSSILGGGMSSRLFQEVREKRGLAYAIGSFNSYFCDNGIFATYAATSNQQFNELSQVIIEELHKLSNYIDESELQRAKAQFKAGILMSQESCSYRAEDLARNYAIYSRSFDYQDVIEQIYRVDSGYLTKLMKKIINNSALSIAVLGNINDLTNYQQISSQFK